MIKLEIKPLSVNEAFKGRRFKTDAYHTFERIVTLILPKAYPIPEPPFEIILEWGFSSSSSDWDNPIKSFQDILAKKYGFNDKLIEQGVVRKMKVPKGKEYIKFELKHFDKFNKEIGLYK
jgi:Holliday junction resolvase RusA-like endonuclease